MATTSRRRSTCARFCDEGFPKATAAIIEPVFQFDPAELKTTALKEGDDFVINGKKTYVPLADEAELFLVYADEGGTTQAYHRAGRHARRQGGRARQADGRAGAGLL